MKGRRKTKERKAGRGVGERERSALQEKEECGDEAGRLGKAGSKWRGKAQIFQKETWAHQARLWGPSFQPDTLPCSAPTLSSISNSSIHPHAAQTWSLMVQPAGPSS